MYKLGVTGPIASGKTALSRILSKLPGALVLDVDQMARGLYHPGSKTYLQVTTAFKNHHILDPSGLVNRRKLGELVFTSSTHLETLNSICFPQLRSEIEARLHSATGYKLAIIDAGVLLQAGWDSLCDEVWTTIVKDEIAVERIILRDRLTREEAISRVASQIPTTERLRRCKVAIETNGSVTELEAKVKTELQRRPWFARYNE